MKRDNVIDVAKGIGIVLVVFAHINFTEPIQFFIYSFHMPLFFIISGVLFTKEKYPSLKQFLSRRIHTLIFPYLLFSIVTTTICIMVKFMIHGVTDELITLTARSFAQIFIAQYSLVYGPNTPMWFVPCLFLTECIYYMITEIENRRVRLLVIILTVLFGWFTESQYCPVDFSIMPWNFSSACFALGFYAIGNLYGKKGILLLKNDERFRVSRLVLILLGIVILGILSQYNGHVSLGSRVLNNGLVFYTTGIVGTLLFL